MSHDDLHLIAGNNGTTRRSGEVLRQGSMGVRSGGEGSARRRKRAGRRPRRASWLLEGLELRRLLTVTALTENVTAVPVISETMTPINTNLLMNQFNAATAPGVTGSNTAIFLGTHVGYATDAHLQINSTIINPPLQPVVNGSYSGNVTTTISVPGQASFPGSALTSMVTQPMVNFTVQPGPGTKTDGSDGKLVIMVNLTDPMTGMFDLTAAQSSTFGYVGSGSVQDPSNGFPHATGSGAAFFTETGGGNESAMTTKFAHSTATLNATYFYVLTGVLSGRKFLDTNPNSTTDNAGDAGLSGWIIHITGTTDEVDKPGGGVLTPAQGVNVSGGITIPDQVTSASGNYSFGNLAPGHYTISEMAPSGMTGFTETFPAPGGTTFTQTYSVVVDASGNVTITNGANSFPSADFGNFVGNPMVQLVKLTNGTNNDTAPGLHLRAGTDTVTWTYQVTNTGGETLNNILVKDDNGTPGNTSDDFTVGTISSLAAGSSTTLTHADGLAIVGQYKNIATATGTGAVTGQTATSSNPDNYFGDVPSVAIVKLTNNTNNDTAP